MTKDQVMEFAKSTAGAHWMDESHIQRFAILIRNLALHDAAMIAENISTPPFRECARTIRNLSKLREN